MLRNIWKYLQDKIEYFKRVKYSLMNNFKKKKKSPARKKSKAKKADKPGLFSLVMVALVGLVVLFFFLKYCGKPHAKPQEMGLDAAMLNYGSDIKQLAQKADLPPEYLMALIMLECSGRAEVPPRFEQGVYDRLLEVKEQRRESLESITYNDLSDASDDALRNLASSWGPFQLMGYKCLHLGIKIKDLRGDNSLYYGVKWINSTYGDYIRKGKYADAFHIHNTGRPVPKNGKYTTYDPKYVPNGLQYMEYFKEKL
ncbi:MAG: hypothetical protein K6F33_02310 [Bacteroidales bacterium]|nr:hypothetical protein [Bacteroidales bacterium]